MPSSSRLSAEERRAAILEAALRLFSKRGFRGTTTRALAEAVGATEPVLYEHFRSKRDLYAAIVQAKSREGFQQGVAMMEPYARARDDWGLFTRLGEFILDLYRKDPAYTRLLLFAVLEEPELGALFYEHQREGRQLLAGYIRRRIEEGAFRPVDPELAARAFLGMFFYLGQVGVLYNDPLVQGRAKPLKEIVEAMVEIFLDGMRTAGARQAGVSRQEVER
ncbi:MAG: TetR/AcrR family transcriptional regulator [Bryobacteraceae bacterium]